MGVEGGRGNKQHQTFLPFLGEVTRPNLGVIQSLSTVTCWFPKEYL
jgi:hypothetical protein